MIPVRPFGALLGASTAVLLAAAPLASGAALPPPAKLRVDRVLAHGMKLRWGDRASGEQRYEVRVEPKHGGEAKTRRLAPNSSGFRSRHLASGDLYEHSVRACRRSSCSPWASVRQATLLAPFGDPYPSLADCQPFPDPPPGVLPTSPSLGDQSAWNQDISQAPVDPDSAQIIARINQDGTEFHPDFGRNPNYGIPYVVVPGAQPDVPVRIGPAGYPDESDFGPAPLPPRSPIEGGSDDHVLVVDRGDCELYELYRGRYLGGPRNRWQADASAFFALDRAVPLRAEGETSADAAGLPIFPGLVRYDEVAAGSIDHALRITFEETRRAYIHPATHYASTDCGQYLPPMGMRLRLRADYPTADLGPQARVIAEALKRYGAFVADNGGNWYVSGATDSRWRDGDLNGLKQISGADFEVVSSAEAPVADC